MDFKKKYFENIYHYESCFEKFGDTHKGFGWPKEKDVDTRHRVMLDVINKGEGGENITLLDFGCGSSHLYEYILRNKFDTVIKYSGLDIVEKFISVSKNKFPSNDYYCLDILDDQNFLPDFDYIVMNGVLTTKRYLSFDDMNKYFQTIVRNVFQKARKGIAFNVMSKQVDWEREDLFHLPFDVLATFLTKHVSRHFVIRHDYGLYEYTVYIYRSPK